MSREIKFRGLSLDGKWVYGYFISNKAYSWIHNDQGGNEAVISDTVGQFTGRKDNNGADIYEGDIIRYDLREGLGMPRINNKKSEVKYYPTGYFSEYYENIVVLGNIHQNPELL